MSEREWRFYLDDMISFAEKALAYTEGLDQKCLSPAALTMTRLCATWNCWAKLPRTFRPISVMSALQYRGDRLSQPEIG